jgi:hypothetical protein
MVQLYEKLTYEPHSTHVLLIKFNPDSVNQFRLQYDVALYDFTTFLIRDYDLSISKIGQMNVLLVQGFNDATDVLRYKDWLNFQDIKPTVKYPGIEIIPVSANNLSILEQGLDINKYLEFYLKNYTDASINRKD